MDDAMAVLPEDYEGYESLIEILFQVHDYIDGAYTIFPEPPWKKEQADQKQQMSMFSLLELPKESKQELDDVEAELEEEIEGPAPDVDAEPQEVDEVATPDSDDPDRLTDAEFAEENKANSDVEYSGNVDANDLSKLMSYLARMLPYSALGRQ